ncbi:polysaccharide pyruvyl transferase family protein [Vulcanisaeta thermophila]|uniref:polysaccharide pyruvyl transferase family protein n=1 Tax=Vulcanisaeta thermophila TaxID=867917 RepID=UPI00138A3ACE|nr:polysaccharide pyruvyl transferase family protein [Vulcanisaeta thermophila]
MSRSKFLRVLIHGYFGFGNTGDEAILTALIDEYRSAYGDVDFVVLSSNPSRTIKLHGVMAVRESLLSPFFWREFLTSDVLVFAGGGRYGGETWRRMALLGLMARLLGKRVVFRSVGVYPYSWHGKPVIERVPRPFTGFTALLVRLLINSSDYVGVRDAYSYAVLRLTGVSRDVVLEPDPTPKLVRMLSDQRCRGVSDLWLGVKRPILGVNLRTLDPGTNRVVLKLVVDVANWFIREVGGSVVFIPFGFGSFSNRWFDNDLIIGRMFKKRVNDVVLIDREMDPLSVMCVVRGVDIMIAMRHHAVVFSRALGKPTVALVYDTKTMEFVKGDSSDTLLIEVSRIDGGDTVVRIRDFILGHLRVRLNE